MSAEEHVYWFIPRGVMRLWGKVEVTMMPFGQDAALDLAEHFAPVAAYVPVYASLEDLRAAHGNVPYNVVRERSGEDEHA